MMTAKAYAVVMQWWMNAEPVEEITAHVQIVLVCPMDPQ